MANQGSRSVAAVDLTRFRVIKQIALDAAPSAILAGPDPERPRAFALGPDSGSVYEIDPAVMAVTRRVRAGGHAVAMQLSHQKDALWLLCREPSALVELPLDTMRPSRRIPLPAPPDSFDLSTSGRAAVASRDARTVVVVSLSRGAVERSVHLPAEPSLIQFRWDGRLVMAGSAPDRSLTMLDVETGKIVVRLPLPVAPMHFCAKPDGGELFISGAGMDAVVVVFPYSTEIGETILAGHAPGAMAVTDTSPSYLLVANPESDSLTALDVWTRRLVGVVRVGQGPSAITITPDKQYVLALNRRSGDMAVIRRTSFADQWVRRYKSASLFTMFPVGDKPVAAAVVRTG